MFGLLSGLRNVLAYTVGWTLSAYLGRKILLLTHRTIELMKTAVAVLLVAGTLSFMGRFDGAGMLVIQVLTGIAVYCLGLATCLMLVDVCLESCRIGRELELKVKVYLDAIK